MAPRPPAVPLSDAEIVGLKQVLTSAHAELQQQLIETKEDAQPVDLSLPIGRLSRMDAMQQQQMSRANRSQYQRRLTQIEAALAVVDAGEYGYCRSCGEPIGIARLQARPETPFCIPCQEALESRP